jgi:hypothetical protein
MHAQRRVLISIGTLALLAVAILLEAIRTRQLGTAVLAGSIAAVAIGVGVTLRRRPLVRLRPDLLAWADAVTAATGEPAEQLVDRAVSAYRARLEGVADDDVRTLGGGDDG